MFPPCPRPQIWTHPLQRMQGGRRRQRGPEQTWKVPNYVVILESGCDIYSYCPKKLAFMRVTTNTFPRAKANFRPSALIQSDEIAGADLWWSLEGSLSRLAYLIQVLS